MPICSFHIKTNIVIPTCASGRFPPVLPFLAMLPSKLGEGDLCLPVGVVARRTIQAASSNYPKFRVKMFGMSVGVVRDWAMSDVQVDMVIVVLI